MVRMGSVMGPADSEKKHSLTLVVMEEPCTACLITADSVKGLIRRIEREERQVSIEVVELSHPSEVAEIPGIEVEKLPALLIDGVQITAGTIPRIDQLRETLRGDIDD